MFPKLVGCKAASVKTCGFTFMNSVVGNYQKNNT